MNTERIAGQDAWARFMKLTMEARVRNTGLSSGSSPVSGSKKTPAGSNPAPLVIKGASYNKNKPEPKKIILGGQFDAYA